MVSASSTSAKNLFVESKHRLCDRVQVNVNNIAAIARQIQRGSKSNEVRRHKFIFHRFCFVCHHMISHKFHHNDIMSGCNLIFKYNYNILL